MIILQRKNENPIMQGKTTLENNETILYNGKKSLTNYCACGKPFVESILETGIVLDSILCVSCEKELAHISEK